MALFTVRDASIRVSRYGFIATATGSIAIALRAIVGGEGEFTLGSRIVANYTSRPSGCKGLLMEANEADYAPIMPFWIDTEGYSDRDREMFVCGVEFQMVYECIKDKRDWCQYIHTENESRVRMMCGKLGVPVKMERHCDTWTHCEIPASTTTYVR